MKSVKYIGPVLDELPHREENGLTNKDQLTRERGKMESEKGYFLGRVNTEKLTSITIRRIINTAIIRQSCLAE